MDCLQMALKYRLPMPPGLDILMAGFAKRCIALAQTDSTESDVYVSKPDKKTIYKLAAQHIEELIAIRGK